jgi:hypothetical protein
VTTFFMTLMNCDLNIYSHIPYKPLQDGDYRQKKPYKIANLCKNKSVNCLNFLHGLFWVLLCIIKLEESCDFYMF